MGELSGKSPVEKFCRWQKSVPLLNLPFCTFCIGAQDLRKNIYLCLCALFDMPKITRNKTRKQTLTYSAPFRPSLCKIGQNAAADLTGRSTFYSATFELCGRTICQYMKHWETWRASNRGKCYLLLGVPAHVLMNFRLFFCCLVEKIYCKVWPALIKLHFLVAWRKHLVYFCLQPMRKEHGWIPVLTNLRFF
jgi:hypothetical protein